MTCFGANVVPSSVGVNSVVDDFEAIKTTSIQLACPFYDSHCPVVEDYPWISSMVPACRGKVSPFVYEWIKCRRFCACELYIYIYIYIYIYSKAYYPIHNCTRLPNIWKLPSAITEFIKFGFLCYIAWIDYLIDKPWIWKGLEEGGHGLSEIPRGVWLQAKPRKSTTAVARIPAKVRTEHLSKRQEKKLPTQSCDAPSYLRLCTRRQGFHTVQGNEAAVYKQCPFLLILTFLERFRTAIFYNVNRSFP
jgi:hypothetical protein